jgi:outer membrane protein assembly factor BamB
MHHRSRVLIATISLALLALAMPAGHAADHPRANPDALLGAADFLPTPQHPVGWRGDWSGRYPGATPPLQWERRVKAITSEIRCQAKKPSGEPGKDSVELDYFSIKDWLVAGPFTASDAKQGIEQDYLGAETMVQPNEGDKAGAVSWKTIHACMDTQTTHIHNGGMCGNLNVDFIYAFGTFSRDDKLNFKVDGDFANKVAYAHTYLYSPSGGTVNLTDLNWGAEAKAWLNGKALPVVVETNQNVWNKKEIEVTLARGWNRLLIKVASGDSAAKSGPDIISRWRSVAYLTPGLPVSYETKNVAWMTRVTGRSMSQPIVVGDRIFIGSAISDLMCFDKTTGKVLWLRSNTPWDAVSAAERAQFKDAVEPLVNDLERMNEQTVTAINAMVSREGMTSVQQEAMDKLLKDKGDQEAKVHKAFEHIDRKRFPPMYGNEVSSSNGTPCSDGSRVYWACGGGMKSVGASIICCFDLAGKRLWSYHEAFGASEHGLHTSPLLVDGKLVYAACHCLIAFDAPTGKLAWRQECDEFCGSSPEVVSIGAEHAIIYKQHATLCRASDGVKFASFDCSGFGEETPVVEKGVIFIPDRFKGWSDNNVAFTALQLPSTTAEKSQLKPLFELNWLKDHVPLRGISYWVASPLYLDGLVYAMDMSGGLMVVDAAGQKSAYRRWLDWYCRYDRYLYGAVASPTLGGKSIYLFDNSGSSIILKPGPVYQELGRNIIENISPSSHSGNPCKQEAFYSSPVFSGDAIYLRGEEYLYAIRGK